MNIDTSKFTEFFRFVVVGVVATALHYGIYLSLLEMFNANTTLSYSFGYFISFIANFYLSAKFTFKERTSVKRGVGFILSHTVNYLLHIAFLNLFLLWGVSEVIAPIPVYMVVVPINFVLVRFVFKSKLFS